MKTCLINCSNPINTAPEADEYVDYREGYAACFNGDKILKKCRSWHSLPAAFGSEFFVYGKPKWQGVYKYDSIMVLINRDPSAVMPLIKKLKTMKKKVVVGFHENMDDFMLQCMNPQWLVEVIKLVDACDGYLNVIPQAHAYFEELFGEGKVLSTYHVTPFGYLDTSEMSLPYVRRQGIFVATRTFNQRLKRNTLLSLLAANKVARKHKTFVTYLNEDPWDAQGLMRILKLERVKVIQGSVPYIEWLKLLGRHKLIINYDMAGTLGQVASDAALVNNVAFGGNSDYAYVAGTQEEDMRLFYKKTDSLVGDLEKYKDFDFWKDEIEKVRNACSVDSVKGKIEKYFEEIE